MIVIIIPENLIKICFYLYLLIWFYYIFPQVGRLVMKNISISYLTMSKESFKIVFLHAIPVVLKFYAIAKVFFLLTASS